MTNIGRAIFDFLKSSTDVVAKVKTSETGSTFQCWPDTLRQGAVSRNSTTSAIVYQMISGTEEHHTGGASGFANVLMQLDAYGVTRLASQELAEQLRRHMDGYRGVMGSSNSAESVHACHLMNKRYIYEAPTDKSDEGRYRMSLDFRIWYGETRPHLGST